MEIWQPGFHEATVRDEKDFRGRQAYIQMNPVEARLAQNPASWPHGSASGWFAIDPIPEALSSGAEAQGQEPAIMSDLKVRPPKEPVSRSTQNSVSEVAVVQRRAAGKKGA